MSLRILLVEDDRKLRATIRDALQLEGYQLITAASFSEALAITSQPRLEKPLDLILLDLGLPDGDGQALLIQLRKLVNTPVIVISARAHEFHKIDLLDSGADDYLVKPFGIGELLARIRVALRHRGLSARAAVTRYEKAGVIIDLEKHKLSRNGEAVHLTPTEFTLLANLVRSAGRVLTHRQLLTEVWGAEYVEHTHYLRLYMAQLRAKLEADPADPKLILTEPGIGYRLAEI